VSRTADPGAAARTAEAPPSSARARSRLAGTPGAAVSATFAMTAGESAPERGFSQMMFITESNGENPSRWKCMSRKAAMDARPCQHWLSAMMAGIGRWPGVEQCRSSKLAPVHGARAGEGPDADGAFAAIEREAGGPGARPRPKGPQLEVGPANWSSWPHQRLLRMRRCRVCAGSTLFVVLYVRSQ
jgi:hypothetical protein